MNVEQPVDTQEPVGVVSQLPVSHQKETTTAGEAAAAAAAAAAAVTQR